MSLFPMAMQTDFCLAYRKAQAQNAEEFFSWGSVYVGSPILAEEEVGPASRDEFWGARMSAAEVTADPAILTRLAEDPYPQVRAAARRNPALPEEAARAALADATDCAGVAELAPRFPALVWDWALRAQHEEGAILRSVADSVFEPFYKERRQLEEVLGQAEQKLAVSRDTAWFAVCLPYARRELARCEATLADKRAEQARYPHNNYNLPYFEREVQRCSVAVAGWEERLGAGRWQAMEDEALAAIDAAKAALAALGERLRARGLDLHC